MDIDDFLARWRFTESSERANKDSFLKDLCRVLGVPEPDGKTGDPTRDTYVFEADSVLFLEGERRSTGKMDLYKQGCFVLEAKQGSGPTSTRGRTARRDTPGWSAAMQLAMGQALGYARTLDQPPPFVIVTDIGYCFDLYACFDGTGAYRPFPNGQKSRHYYSDLSKHTDLLRAIWLNPMDLDPTRRAETVTREIAEKLAELALDLETAGHASQTVAKFLMRCVFCMFAEDIGLLRDQVFTKALDKHWIPEPASFKEGVEALWEAMNEGKRFFTLGKLLHFNGGLFAKPEALPLNAKQLKILQEAARREWSEVQPAIFGTLIERALHPTERHQLGAHFTPTAYVERLLVPTIEEPLRADWELVRVQVRELVPANEPAKPSNVKKARGLVEDFHQRLCNTTVLDPACGSGNFLYLTLNLFKRLESEVLSALHDLGVDQLKLEQELLVTPKQFKGIERRPESKEIAELVLWIGYLQWHHRMYGQTKSPPEPVLRDYKNIECRDAVLTNYQAEAPEPRARSKRPRRSKRSSSRSQLALAGLADGESATEAEWPEADFIVGNPPFIGNSRMRRTLGERYAEAIRKVYADLPESCDYVMYWWHKAATRVRTGRARRFGLITTNSIRQTFNRKIVQAHLTGAGPLSLLFAVPDHPWVDSSDGAAVRISMTVAGAGSHVGRLLKIQRESSREGALPDIEFAVDTATIAADLSVGADLTSAVGLRANEGLSCPGVKLHGSGFIVTAEKAKQLGLGKIKGLSRHIREYRNGRDLTQRSRGVMVVDLLGLSLEQVQSRFPELFQHIYDEVKPERDSNPRASYREKWWILGEPRSAFRPALTGLSRYIATVETAKHRVFMFLDSSVLADNKLIVIAVDDAYVLGVLSSRTHVAWALAAGGWLGVGNDPCYVKTRCFETFPFPEATHAQRRRIAELAERLDKHRTRQQAEHPRLTLTSVYNVLDKVRAEEALTAKEQLVYQQGLVSVLRAIHDDLDAAVLDAYGWDSNVSDGARLKQLLALNKQRAAEEVAGQVRWLRPRFQMVAVPSGEEAEETPAASMQQLKLPWPAELPLQVASVRDLIITHSRALTANDVAEFYSGASAQAVVPALETLEALGMAASFTDGERQWKGLAGATGERTHGNGRQATPSHPPPSQQLRAVSR